MTKKKFIFMGILTNTDSSILKINLDHGFKIESLSQDEGFNLLSHLEKVPEFEIAKNSFIYLHENKLNVIINSFDVDVEMKKNGSLKDFPSEISKFDNELYLGYLAPIIRLMRLYNGGNICMPLIYYFFIDNDVPNLIMRRGTILYVSHKPKFTLNDSEISDFQTFIKNTKLPFDEPNLQLAFENFELSYESHNTNLSFLSLMISLEALFNPGGGELGYRIRRNTAVLLGDNHTKSVLIDSDIKELYNKRSKIVHEGKTNIVDENDLSKLRNYVKDSIKLFYQIGKNKKELLEILNSCGYGKKPWL